MIGPKTIKKCCKLRSIWLIIKNKTKNKKNLENLLIILKKPWIIYESLMKLPRKFRFTKNKTKSFYPISKNLKSRPIQTYLVFRKNLNQHISNLKRGHLGDNVRLLMYYIHLKIIRIHLITILKTFFSPKPLLTITSVFYLKKNRKKILKKS